VGQADKHAVWTSHQPVSQPMLPAITPVAVLKSLSMDVRKTVSQQFIIFRVDYCDSLLAGVPRYQLDRLQSVMNTAARLIFGAKKHGHVKHDLRDRLQWLPVPQRVQFKLCLLTHKALHGLASSYIADLCRPVTSVGSRQRLWSATRGDLVVCSSVMHFGTHAFAVAAGGSQGQEPATDTSTGDS